MGRIIRSGGFSLYFLEWRTVHLNPQIDLRTCRQVLESLTGYFDPTRRQGRGKKRGFQLLEMNDRKQARAHNTRLLHQLIDSPSNVEPSQVAVVLTHAQEDDGDSSSVDHADKRANHVAHCVALGDDEAVHSDAVVAELTLLYMSVDCRKK
jgi:hypothetical protein